MAETKHGGSPASGVVLPAGIEQHTAEPGSRIIKPEIARTNEQAKERALQFERRRLALSLMGQPEEAPKRDFSEDEEREFELYLARRIAMRTSIAIRYADELLKQTGGVI